MRSNDVKEELFKAYSTGQLGYYLDLLADHAHNPNIIEDEEIISRMVNAGKSLIFAGRIDVAVFMKRTNNILPKPWTRFGEDVISAMIGRMIVDDHYHHIKENNLLKILKEEWGSNKAFLDAVVPIVGAAYGMYVESDIKRKIRQREQGSFSIAYGTEELFKYIVPDYPEIFSSSPLPLTMYLDYILSEKLSEADVDAAEAELDNATPEELLEVAKEFGLTETFSRADIRQKIMDMVNSAPDPEFFTIVQENKVFWDGVVAHCRQYSDEFPHLAKRLGFVSKPSVDIPFYPS